MPVISPNFSPEQITSADGSAFISSLKDPQLWSSIPLLNYTPLHELKDMSIVRFRGMIQDMLDPEIYLERYEVLQRDGKTTRNQQGKYRDCFLLNEGEKVNHESKSNVHGERRTLFVISIPGLNDWCKDYESQCSRYFMPQKLMLAESSDGEIARKRSAPMNEESMDFGIEGTGEQNNCDAHKRICTEEIVYQDSKSNVKTNTIIGTEYHLNSPIPDRPSKACMIKIYDDFDKYKLNTIVDVVGFLSVSSALDASTMDTDEFDNVNEIQAQNPPPSLIPRLHAISVHCLPHHNPLLDERLLSPLPERSNNSNNNINMLSVGNDFRTFLKLCLFNDTLAADYLLAHLMSSVYCRVDSQCLGRFLVNLFNIPLSRLPNYSKKFYDLLDMIIPASHLISMTAATMNDSTFGPKKDYETNKLVSGMLQLAPHTHLVIDETNIKPEALNGNGVLSMTLLRYVMNHQQLKCNFQFYEIGYDVDIPILSLSEKKSVLPYDAFIPIEYDGQSIEIVEESLNAASHFLNADRLGQFRRFLTLAKLVEFCVNETESEMIQNDFVEMRKAKTIRDAEELHHLLVLARLLSIARGENVLVKDAWELAKEMESTRQKRFDALPNDITRKRTN